MPADALDARLQDLLDRQALLDLIHAYCRAADRHDQALMRSLYHEDAVDDHGHFANGPAMAFIDRLPQIQAPMAILHHNVTTVNLRLDEASRRGGGATRAEGEVYILAFHQVRENDREFDVLIGGRYFDRYEQRDGRWKFAHRAIVADWCWTADPSRVQLDHPFLAGAHIGRPGPQDPSYRFFSLLRRGAD